MRLTRDVPAVSRMRKIGMATVAACALLGASMTAVALPLDVAMQEKVYKPGGDVKPPVLTYSVDAVYPKNHKEKKNTIVVCSLVVSPEGLPTNIKVKRSAGKDFDENAMEAVRQFRFKPAMRKGEPVAVAIVIEVNFQRY